MAVRFRIRTSAGQELSFASHEIFEEFVRAGDLSPDDLVYDGETGSWSPARTHPIVLEIEYEREAESGGASGEGDQPAADLADPAPSAESPAEAVPADGSSNAEAPESLEFDLVPADERSPDDDKRAFVEKMEAERASDLARESFRPDRIEGFTREDSSSLSGMLAPSPPPPEPKEPAGTPSPPAPHRPRRPTRPRHERAPQPRPNREPSSTTASSGIPSPVARKRRAPRLTRPVGLLLALGLAGAAAYWFSRASLPAEELVADPIKETAGEPPGVVPEVRAEMREPVPGRATEPAERPAQEPRDEPVSGALGTPDVLETPEAMAAEGIAPPPPSREPVIAANEAAVRGRAQERFLGATQNALRELPPIPELWPGGQYLSLPTEHPEVVDVWQSYVATIREVRGRDEERYRAAYEAALDDAAIEGEVREARLSSALADFRASAGSRDRHYDRVESLAIVAIQSHNTLSEIEGLVLYDAVGDGGGLGGGTTTRDAESRRVLDQVLSRLGSALDADGLGPREGVRVREWVWDGVLDAVAR